MAFLLSYIIHDYRVHLHVFLGFLILQDIVSATAALEEVKQSKKLARMLELILLAGNYMNSGSRNEQSIGFELSYLTKVRSD